jgi:hypothetical protein
MVINSVRYGLVLLLIDLLLKLAVNPRSIIVDLIAKHSHECRHSGEPFGITVVTDIVVNASCFALVCDAGQPLEWPARYPVLWKFLVSGGHFYLRP